MLCYVMLNYVMSCYVILRYVMSYQVMSCNVMPCSFMFCHVKISYGMSWDAVVYVHSRSNSFTILFSCGILFIRNDNFFF